MGNQESQSRGSRGFRWWAVRLFASSHMLMFGLLVTCAASEVLSGQRPGLIAAPWNYTLTALVIICMLWGAIAAFPRISSLSESAEIDSLTALRFISLVGGLFLISQRNNEWSVLCIGPVAAVYVWSSYRKAQWPNPIIAAFGFCIASPAVFFVLWPDAERFSLVFCIGGLATVLQGLIVFLRSAGRLKQAAIEPVPTAGV